MHRCQGFQKKILQGVEIVDELIDLYALKVFESVARNKSFSKAAEELFLSQPAVSQQIKSLEEQLGTKLFYRTSKEIVLTETGELLYKHAQSILNSATRLKELVSRSQQAEPAHLTIGLSYSVSAKYISKILNYIEEKHPDVNFKVVIDHSNELQKIIMDLRIDFAIISGNLNYSLLAKDRIYTDKIVLLSSKANSIGSKEKVSVKDIKNQVFLFQQKGSGIRALVDKYLARYRINPSVSFEIPDTVSLLKAIEDNVGIGFLPKTLWENTPFFEKLISYDLKEADLPVEINLVYHRDKVFRPLEINLINFIFSLT